MQFLFKPHKNIKKEKPRKIIPFNSTKELLEYISNLCKVPEKEISLSITKHPNNNFIAWDTHLVTLTYTVTNTIRIRKRVVAGFTNKVIEEN